MSELRRDPVDGRWVIIAAERRKRPVDFYTQEYKTEGADKCPFDVGKEHQTPPEIYAIRDPGSIPNGPGWQLRVIPNKYPALRIEGELTREGVGHFDRMSGTGAHEVLIETPQHNLRRSEMTIPQLENVYRAYRERMVDLRHDRRFKYVLIFKNYGEAAGASLAHPHSQLIALPILPKHIVEEMNGCREYYHYKERCIFCDIIHQEVAMGERMVCSNEGFIAVCPWAPIFPFEIWILPRNHDSCFEDGDPGQLSNLAAIMLEVHKRLDASLRFPHYNTILHTSPFDEQYNNYYHWHMEIMPRITRVAGFEYGSGFYINPVPPEEAAQFLREIEIS
jgi:UDPglucose--hexose-1-phosphate uridylyltransferase